MNEQASNPCIESLVELMHPRLARPRQSTSKHGEEHAEMTYRHHESSKRLSLVTSLDIASLEHRKQERQRYAASIAKRVIEQARSHAT
jgi:hypothetical protein